MSDKNRHANNCKEEVPYVSHDEDIGQPELARIHYVDFIKFLFKILRCMFFNCKCRAHIVGYI